jgi:hypothetical protein
MQTPTIPREQLMRLLESDEERRTVLMQPLQLQHLLLPERQTANLVVLLDKPKREPRRHYTAMYFVLAIAFFALGFYLA